MKAAQKVILDVARKRAVAKGGKIAPPQKPSLVRKRAPSIAQKS